MDVERHLLRHLVDADSLKTLHEERVRPHLFQDITYGEVVGYALDYFMRSGFRDAPTVELLADAFPQIREDLEVEDRIVCGVLIEKVKTKYARNRLLSAIDVMAEAAAEDPLQGVTTGLDELVRVKIDTSPLQRAEPWAVGMPQRLTEYHENIMDESMAAFRPGIPFPWPEVTEETFGIRNGEVAVFLARPGKGKSWTMGLEALVAAQFGVPTYFASLENGREMTHRRLDCLVARVPYRDYERGRLSQAQIEALREASEVVADLGDLLIVDCPIRAEDRTVSELYSRARYHGCQLLVGDQLSWLTPRGEFRGDRADFAAMSEAIQDVTSMARETQIASIWAGQFNREGARRGGRGSLEHIAMSDKISQNVDWAFGLSRTKDMEDNDQMVLEIIKARRSRPMAWLLDWSLETETRLEVLREYEEAE
jgi:replicative DNA helicase